MDTTYFYFKSQQMEKYARKKSWQIQKLCIHQKRTLFSENRCHKPTLYGGLDQLKTKNTKTLRRNYWWNFKKLQLSNFIFSSAFNHSKNFFGRKRNCCFFFLLLFAASFVLGKKDNNFLMIWILTALLQLILGTAHHFVLCNKSILKLWFFPGLLLYWYYIMHYFHSKKVEATAASRCN